VALEYDARHFLTRRPIAKDSEARRVVILYYDGPAMEGPGLTENTTQELSVGGPPSQARPVGGPPIQSSPSDGCILEHPGYLGAPEYCLYSSRRPAERNVRSRRVADALAQIGGPPRRVPLLGGLPTRRTDILPPSRDFVPGDPRRYPS
jgi:hypothetical protein